MASKYEQSFEELHKLFERKLYDFVDAYKLTTEGVPNAYEIFNSPKVESLLEHKGKTFKKLMPGKIDATAFDGRFTIAFGVVQDSRLQNEDPAFCKHAQKALNEAKKILSDKKKESAYSKWVPQKKLKELEFEQDEQRPTREKALQQIRAQATAKREAEATIRQNAFREQQKRRQEIEKAIEENLTEKKGGFWSKLGDVLRNAPCMLGTHKGEWFYDDPNCCELTRTCQKCTKVSTKIEHSWQVEKRLIDTECEFIKICTRCGEEEIYFQHKWQWEYLNSTGCTQQQKCSHCQETDNEIRVQHDWGPWKESGFDYAPNMRTCKRCGEKEVQENKNISPSSHILDVNSNDNGIHNSTLSLAGMWTDPDGYSLNIAQNGNQLTLHLPPMGQMIGMGTVNGNQVSINYTLSNGYVSESVVGKLSLAPDGRQMMGTLTFQSSGNTINTVLRKSGFQGSPIGDFAKGFLRGLLGN